MNLFPPPGPERRKQLVALGIAIGALTAVIWYQWRPAAPAVRALNTAAPATPTFDPLKLPESVKIAELAVVPAQTEIGRNPFGFGARPAPPPPPVAARPPVALAPAPPPPPPVPQGPPPIGLKLEGRTVLPSTGRTMVTLKDPGTGAVFSVFEGDVVDGRYRVIKVGLQSVVLSYVDGTGQRTIPLGE